MANLNESTWEGDERRETKRRYTMDRRALERKKRYMFTIILPTLLGIMGAGVVSWGAFITHATYSISAKYEETFVDHIDDQHIKETAVKTRLDHIVDDYDSKLGTLHDDMNDGFREIRVTLNLLLQRGAGSDNSDGESK